MSIRPNVAISWCGCARDGALYDGGDDIARSMVNSVVELPLIVQCLLELIPPSTCTAQLMWMSLVAHFMMGRLLRFTLEITDLIGSQPSASTSKTLLA